LKSESADVGDELTVLRQVTRCLTSQALENQDDNLEVEGLVRASTEGLRMKDLVFPESFRLFCVKVACSSALTHFLKFTAQNPLRALLYSGKVWLLPAQGYIPAS